MQRVLRLVPPEEVPAPVEERHAPLLPPAAHDDPPVAVGGHPRRRGVAERGLVDVVVGDDQGVAVGLHPLAQVGVGEVGRNGEVLHLRLVLVDNAGVEDDGLVAGEHGGGARPAAEFVERFGREDRRLHVFPAHQIFRNCMSPNYVAPHCSLWIVLVEKVVDSIVEHWS